MTNPVHIIPSFPAVRVILATMEQLFCYTNLHVVIIIMCFTVLSKEITRYVVLYCHKTKSLSIAVLIPLSCVNRNYYRRNITSISFSFLFNEVIHINMNRVSGCTSLTPIQGQQLFMKMITYLMFPCF